MKQQLKNREEIITRHQIEVMFELFRSAVFDRTPVIEPDIIIDWEDLMDRSSSQGILAWVWDGICKLPKEQQPPRQQRINWSLSAQNIWDRYPQQYEVLSEMVKICNQNNIRLLLLKGIGLAELYPKPESRPSGDIDVYFFDDYERGNSLFCQDEISEFRHKHTSFNYKGVHIENHLTPIDTDTRNRAIVQKYLKDNDNSIEKTDQGYYIYKPIVNLIYLLMHVIRHFHPEEPAPVKMIAEVGIFLKRKSDSIPKDKLCSILKDLRLLKPFLFVVYYSEVICGFSLDEYHFEIIREKDQRFLKDLLLTGELYEIKNEFETFSQQFRYQWQRFLSVQRICKYIDVSRFQYVCYLVICQCRRIVKSILGLSQNTPLRGYFKVS